MSTPTRRVQTDCAHRYTGRITKTICHNKNAQKIGVPKAYDLLKQLQILYINFARDTQAVVDMYRVGLRRRDITIRCTERLHLEERRHRCVDRQRDTHPKSVDPNDLFREHAMSRETLKCNTGEGLRNEGSVAVSFRGLRIARASQ